MTTPPTVLAELLPTDPPTVGVTITAADADTVSVTRVTAAGRERLLGGQDVVIAGSAYVVDHTAPLNEPVWYVATAVDSGVTSDESAPSNTVTLETATTGVWISDPTIPASALLVRVASWGMQVFETAGEAVVPIGGSRPIALTAPRQTVSTEVTFNARSQAERSALRHLFATAPVLLVRAGLVHGEPARYCLAGRVVERRLARDYYELDAQMTEVAPPSRIAAYGAPGTTYGDLAGYYVSYDDPALTSQTYLDLAKDPRP